VQCLTVAVSFEKEGPAAGVECRSGVLGLDTVVRLVVCKNHSHDGGAFLDRNKSPAGEFATRDSVALEEVGV
jgi:hypothetical protein